MSCVINNSRKATIVDMINRNLIDKYHNILDLNGFRSRVTWLTKYAKNTYGVDEGRLFLEENNGKKAIPNTAAFSKIDQKKSNFNKREYKDNGIMSYISENESDASVKNNC